MAIEPGYKYISDCDSTGGSFVFWVNNLSCKIDGSVVKGDLLEVQEYRETETKIEMRVTRVEKKLDIPIEDTIKPASLVGIDPDVSVAPNPNISAVITSLVGQNRVFLILLRVQYHKRTKVRIPLTGTGNVVEYTYEGA